MALTVSRPIASWGMPVPRAAASRSLPRAPHPELEAGASAPRYTRRRGEHVKVRGSAKVDDDRRRAVQAQRGKGVDEAIRAGSAGLEMCIGSARSWSRDEERDLEPRGDVEERGRDRHGRRPAHLVDARERRPSSASSSLSVISSSSAVAFGRVVARRAVVTSPPPRCRR